MTFLLFLASLAVIEWLVRKPRKKSDLRPEDADHKRHTADLAAPAAPSSPGLLALGQALDAAGRGKSPNRKPAPQVHAPPVDRV